MKTGFKWRNLIELSPEWGEAERIALEGVLNTLEPLHVMQETLRDIPLNKLYHLYAEGLSASEENQFHIAQPDKITLSPRKIGGGYSGGYSPFSRNIILDPELKFKHCYHDHEGRPHKMSLTRTILHELEHTIDPDLVQLSKEAHRKLIDKEMSKFDAFIFLNHYCPVKPLALAVHG